LTSPLPAGGTDCGDFRVTIALLQRDYKTAETATSHPATAPRQAPPVADGRALRLARRRDDAHPIPRRHWRRHGTDPLPTGIEALDEPFAAFPSWYICVTCERCGQDRMFNEAHSSQCTMRIRDIIEKMRHDGCGGRAGKAELLTGQDGASSWPVRRIVLRRGEP